MKAMTPPLLSVSNLAKTFVARRNLLGRATALVQAVDGVSFEVAAGETLALVGESGCGKSTVGRLVLDLIAPSAGKVEFDGRDIATFDTAAKRAFRASAQLIFQDPYASLNPRMTVGQTLDEPMMLHTDMSKSDRRARDCLLGAMRAARWWFVATARVDAGESGIHARGGFLVDAGQDEALEADVLAYYLFGSMILDRLAAYATGTDLDGAWKRWLKELDGEPATQTRSLARQLDICLRVTRDKLVAHIETHSRT